MNIRLLSTVTLTWLALACSDQPGPTPPPVGVAGVGGAAAGGGGAGGLAGSSGSAGSAGLGGSGGTAGAGGAGGSGGGPVMKAMQLKDTGLFSASAMGTLPDGVTVGPVMTMAAGVHAFTPQFALWSDSAGKRRWVYMPPDKKITTDFDSGSMDYWLFPAGFKLWKEFSRDGKVIETRILEKLGDGYGDWYMVAYVWNADYTDAVATPLGLPNAMGTMHDVPGEEGCDGCHANMQDRALGFTALQLSHSLPDSLTLQQISDMGWLTTPPATMPVLPGNDVEKGALGYLHANCGHCHNTRANIYKTSADIDLWTHVNELQGATVQTLRAYLSMVCDEWPGPGNWSSPIKQCMPGHATGTRFQSNLSALEKRIVPGNPAMSGVHELMNLRSGGADMRQMPPIGTETVDTAGMTALDAWINALPVE